MKLTVKRFVVPAFFAVYFITGLCLYRNFGVSFDEPLQRLQGMVSGNYVIDRLFPGAAPIPGISLQSFANKQYGVAFDMPAYWLELWLHLDADSPAIYYLRHFLTFAVFFVGVIYLYKIVARHYGDRNLGLLAGAFLILSPRIFGESFYNNKDIVFLGIFIIGIYYLLRFLEKKTWLSALLFSIVCALAIGVRMPGLILPVAGLLFYGFEIAARRSIVSKKDCIALATLIAGTIICTVCFWPTLWENPLGNFQEAYVSMANYPWNGQVLYAGSFIHAHDLPWHYIPVWIGLTTPVLYSVLFLSGLAAAIRRLVVDLRRRLYNSETRWYATALFLCFAPWLLVLVSGSTLYDGWRHMYFIYGPFLLLSIIGFVFWRDFLGRQIRGRWPQYALAVITGLCLLTTMTQIIRRHPFENVYFNALAGNPENKFDVDYWGLSYRQAWEYLLKTAEGPLRVSVNQPPGVINTIFISPEDRARIALTDPEHADYIFTEYRYKDGICEYHDPIKIFYSGKVRVMGIYKGPQHCESVVK